MKKFLSLSLTAVLLLGLFGCSAKAPSPDTRFTESETAGLAEATVLPENTECADNPQPSATTVSDIEETTVSPHEDQDEWSETPRQPTQQETVSTITITTNPAVTGPAETEFPMPEVATNPTELPTEATIPRTELVVESIDISALESYGRSYAEQTYGYWGNPATGFSSNAGFYPPSYRTIQTMEEGYQAVREIVDAQYWDDVGAGQQITAEINGTTVRRKINVYFQPTNDPNVFLLYCFYGGE